MGKSDRSKSHDSSSSSSSSSKNSHKSHKSNKGHGKKKYVYIGKKYDEPTEFDPTIPEDLSHEDKVQFQRMIIAFEESGYEIDPNIPPYLPNFARIKMTVDSIEFDESLPVNMPLAEKLRFQKQINDFEFHNKEYDPNVPLNFPKYLRVQISNNSVGFHPTIPTEMELENKIKYQKCIKAFEDSGEEFPMSIPPYLPYYMKAEMAVQQLGLQSNISKKEIQPAPEPEEPVEEPPAEEPPAEEQAELEPEPPVEEAPAPEPKPMTPEEMQMQMLLDMQNLQMIG